MNSPLPTARAVIREATSEDAAAIASLHADSWRRYYRGALSDAFLDGEVDEDRRSVWRERLAEESRRTATITTHSAHGQLVGFAHVIFNDDPAWGSLLDNLHVRHDHQRSGIGRVLVAEVARRVVVNATGPLYLWVLEQNLAAQMFYAALGGTVVERVARDPQPGYKLRVSWTEAASLLRCASSLGLDRLSEGLTIGVLADEA